MDAAGFPPRLTPKIKEDLWSKTLEELLSYLCLTCSDPASGTVRPRLHSGGEPPAHSGVCSSCTLNTERKITGESHGEKPQRSLRYRIFGENRGCWYTIQKTPLQNAGVTQWGTALRNSLTTTAGDVALATGV